MRLTERAVRSRKRRAITRRDWTSDWRRRARPRTWAGTRPRQGSARPLFFALGTQQVSRLRPLDWLGAAAMLLGVFSWGVLVALLGA
jgi:hypothetical protein